MRRKANVPAMPDIPRRLDNGDTQQGSSIDHETQDSVLPVTPPHNGRDFICACGSMSHYVTKVLIEPPVCGQCGRIMQRWFTKQGGFL